MGKLKILASDHKRADSVGANKNLKFLNEILIDHKKVMQQNKEEIKVDLDMGNFEEKPGYAVKTCLRTMN